MYAPQRKHLTQTIDDWIHPPVIETRSGDEVAQEVIDKIGITIKE